MKVESVISRQTILELALQEAFHKRDECEANYEELDDKLSEITADGCSFEEKERVIDSMLFLKDCRDRWEETINYIKVWQEEIKIKEEK
ncbi:hypothetical protein [Niallia taxi]|uniref:hypothetical protein n=1 Tax=Niallia taxi TaxID=2499688 RepID=UPI0030097511